MYRQPLVIAACCGILLALSACTSNPQKRLERVAKDWSMTIRASQVMPIYPLEEDLRPGDVYLSTRSMESDIASWNERGFLPLVNRYARIHIPQSDYAALFEDAAGTDSPSFTRLPKASFPSYTFEVDRRGSLGLAIPLDSVPVALAMAGAQSATGSVVLKKATSLGLPDMVMDRLIREWASQHRSTLAREAGRAFQRGKPLVLRAITRVFSIQGANVSLTYQKAMSFGLDAGAEPTPPKLLSASKEDFAKRLAELETRMSTLQTQPGGLPGGTARIASRSAHGVSLVEEFEKPLVVGYWALEYLVLTDGSVLSVGNLQDLIDDPASYQRRVELAMKLVSDGPPIEGTRFKEGMQLPDRR